MAKAKFLTLARFTSGYGIPVVPGFPGEKFSRLGGWPALATTNDMQLQAWDRENEDFNVIAVAKKGVVVIIDIDEPSVADRLPETLPATLTVRTPGGGLHVYFLATAASDQLGNVNVRRIGDYIVPDAKGNATCLLELKSHNVTVAAPGSVNAEGTSYKPIDKSALCPIPAWLTDWIEENCAVPTLNDDDFKGRKMHPGFEAADWFEWYEQKKSFSVGDPIDKGSYDLFIPANGCIYKGDFHEQSPKTGFIVSKEDERVSYSCFAAGCAGCGVSIQEVMDHLEDEGFEPYPYPMYEDEDDDEFLKGVAIDDALDELEPDEPPTTELVTEEDEPEEVVPAEPVEEVEPVEPEPVTPKEKCGDDTIDMLAEGVVNILLRNSESIFSNYALYRKRLAGRTAEIGFMPLYDSFRYVLKYEETFNKLPGKTELLDFIVNHTVTKDDDADSKLKAVQYLQQLEDKDTSLTLDTTVQRFIHKADLQCEKRAWKIGFSILKKDEDIQAARQAVREVWATSLALGGDHGFKPGAIQESDHIEMLKDLFRKDVEGTNDARKFNTGFPSIDQSTLNIGLDNEHAICVFGPSNNAKTSLVLSMAYNFAQQGKNGIIFVGEHQADKVEKSVALMHSHCFKSRFTIPAISRWENRTFKPTKQDLVNMHIVLDDLGSMKTLPGYLEIQNINSIGGSLDSMYSYLESTHKKYDWDYFIVDPFDSVVSEEDKNGTNSWGVSKDAVNSIFSYTRDYQGGRGILALVTAQILSKPAREIEKIQAEDNEDIEGLTSVLRQDKQIQFFTTLVQRFDLALGVSLVRKKGREGLIVQGRTRGGSDFDWLRFKLDPSSWYAEEKNPPREIEVGVDFMDAMD